METRDRIKRGEDRPFLPRRQVRKVLASADDNAKAPVARQAGEGEKAELALDFDIHQLVEELQSELRLA